MSKEHAYKLFITINGNYILLDQWKAIGECAHAGVQCLFVKKGYNRYNFV